MYINLYEKVVYKTSSLSKSTTPTLLFVLSFEEIRVTLRSFSVIDQGPVCFPR